MAMEHGPCQYSNKLNSVERRCNADLHRHFSDIRHVEPDYSFLVLVDCITVLFTLGYNLTLPKQPPTKKGRK